MACFLVPASEAVVTTVATKVIEKKKVNNENFSLKLNEVTTHLHRLNKLLWGGSALLAFEHLYHGEVQPFFPFLTAMESAEETAEMLHEMSTVGVGMAIAITAVWAVGIVIGKIVSKVSESGISVVKKGVM